MSQLRSVLADTRHMSPDALDSLTFDASVATALGDTPLNVGNIMALAEASEVLAIWYLEPAQLLALLRDGELFTRAALLRLANVNAYLIACIFTEVNGKVCYGSTETGFSWPALQGALLTVQEYGVQIVQIGSPRGLGPMIAQLAAHSRQPKKLQPVRDALFASVPELVLGAFEGLGEKRVNALLQSAGSLADALADLSDLRITIPGIPKSVQIKAREALGLTSKDGLETILTVTAREAQATAQVQELAA